jgi:hypothetical protein
MIEHVWSVLCKSSSIDKRTNNISLFEVIETIRIDWFGMPTVSLAPMEIVSLWTRDVVNTPAYGQARIYVTSPSGHDSLHQIQDIDLRSYRRVRVRYIVSALHVDGLGLYNFSVEHRDHEHGEWRHVARLPLDVIAKG